MKSFRDVLSNALKLNIQWNESQLQVLVNTRFFDIKTNSANILRIDLPHSLFVSTLASASIDISTHFFRVERLGQYFGFTVKKKVRPFNSIGWEGSDRCRVFDFHFETYLRLKSIENKG